MRAVSAADWRAVATLCGLLLCLFTGCSSFGGDDSSGLTARPVLSGGGTWVRPASRTVDALSTEPAVRLELQGATADGFTNADGTVFLQVLPRDAAGRVVLGELDVDSFAVDVSSLRLEPVVQVGGGQPTVVSAAVSEVAVKPPTEEGLTGMLLFDSSFSTKVTDRQRRRVDAARAFIGGMPAGTQLAVMDFGVANGGLFGRPVVSEGLQASRLLADFSALPEVLLAAVDRVTSSGGTPMYAALEDGLSVLEAVHARGAEELFLVVLTDGAAGDFDESRAAGVVSRANALGMPIHTVALTGQGADDDVSLAQLQSLAALTAGLSFTAFGADELVAHFAQLTGAVDARVTVRVDLKFSTALQAGNWRLRGELELVDGASGPTVPFEVVFGVE